MANITINRAWNSNKMLQIEDLRGMTFQSESGGHTFVISGIDNTGNSVSLSGAATGVMLRPDNTDQALECYVSGGKVYATLPAACYSVPGRFGITVFLTSGGHTTAIYAAIGTVSRTSSGTVSPGTTADVMTLINLINQTVATIPQDYSALSNQVSEIWAHTKYTNTSGNGGQANIRFSGKAGQTLRIVTDAATVNLNTRATETGTNIQTQYVGANTTFELAITSDFEWLHLYYTTNGTTNFYIVETVLGEAVDDIASLKAADIKLQSEINGHDSIISANLMGIDVQDNLYDGASTWAGTWLNSDTAHVSVSNEKYMGYPTVYSSESWRRFAKNIPVVAGKTYTFEGWIKQSVAGSVLAYLTTNDFTTNKATVSPNVISINNVPANTWIKVSLTFACTVSGNVSPYIIGANGAFYVAKYTLVEGNTVFSLDESLKDKATKQEVSGIGDYLKYSFAGGSEGQYYNPEIQKSIPSGTKVKLIFDSYSGSKLSYVRIDGKKSDNSYTNSLCRISSPVHGGTAEFTATEDYISLRIQFGRTETETATASIYLVTTDELGIANDLLSMNSQRVFYIAKDGSGDYSSFVEGINAACQFMDSIVYVGAGTYDLLDELGSDYIKSAGSQKMGLVLKNRVRVICSSQTVLEMDNKRSLYDSDDQYNAAKEYLSPINTGVYGCTLENATIIDNNVRYSIHDDQGWSGSTPYTNKFINCTLIHKNGMYGDCIGGGLGENCEIEIRGCYLEGESNVVRLAYYHGNNHTGITTAKGRVTVCDNYFAGVGTFQMTNYGDSEETSMAYVSNNSVGTAPSVTNAGTTVGMKAWNNEIRA